MILFYHYPLYLRLRIAEELRMVVHSCNPSTQEASLDFAWCFYENSMSTGLQWVACPFYKCVCFWGLIPRPVLYH
jgi:hypothetical protein